MLQYTKYIMWRVAKSTLSITACITAIFWLLKSLQLFDFVVSRGLSIGLFFHLSLLLLPLLLWMIVPFSIFIATLHAYNKLTSDSELVVLKSAGISTFNLAKPAILSAVLAMLLSYSIGLYLLPISFSKYKEAQTSIQNNQNSLMVQEGMFNSLSSDVVLYARDRDNAGVLSGIIIHDTRDREKSVTTIAEKGKLTTSKNGILLTIENGNQQEVNITNGELSLLHFARYSIDLTSAFTPKDTLRFRKAEEYFLPELFREAAKATKPSYSSKLYAEAHERIIWPIYNITFALLAVLPFLTGQFSRRGSQKNIVIASITATILTIVIFMCNNVLKNNSNFTPLVYSLATGSLLITSYLLFKDDLQKLHKKIPRVT